MEEGQAQRADPLDDASRNLYLRIHAGVPGHGPSVSLLARSSPRDAAPGQLEGLFFQEGLEVAAAGIELALGQPGHQRLGHFEEAAALAPAVNGQLGS